MQRIILPSTVMLALVGVLALPAAAQEARDALQRAGMPPQAPAAAADKARPSVVVLAAAGDSTAYDVLLGLEPRDVLQVDAADERRGDLVGRGLDALTPQAVLIVADDVADAAREARQLIAESPRLRAAMGTGRVTIEHLWVDGSSGQFALTPMPAAALAVAPEPRAPAKLATEDQEQAAAVDTKETESEPAATAGQATGARVAPTGEERSSRLASHGSAATGFREPVAEAKRDAATLPPAGLPAAPAQALGSAVEGASPSALSYLFGPLAGLLLAVAIIAYTRRQALVPAVERLLPSERAAARTAVLEAEAGELEKSNPRLRDALARVREKLRVWEHARRKAGEALSEAEAANARAVACITEARRRVRGRKAEADREARTATTRAVVGAAAAVRQVKRHIDQAQSALGTA